MGRTVESWGPSSHPSAGVCAPSAWHRGSGKGLRCGSLASPWGPVCFSHAISATVWS